MRERGYSDVRLALIKKAASLSLEGYTVAEIAQKLKVSESKVHRLLSTSEGLAISCILETTQVAPLLDLDLERRMAY
jgi:DNA-binding transcriptional regulator LsrR (DeoR family)